MSNYKNGSSANGEMKRNESTSSFGYLKDCHDYNKESIINPSIESSETSGETFDANNNSNNINNDRKASLASGSVNSLLPPNKLSLKTKLFYSLGHIYNDLTVSIWFSYTLLFFQYRFSGSLGGALILLGQVADAIASPFVGYESDKSGSFWLCARYGKRKTWHLLGVIMNTISVPLVYNQCLGCNDAPQWSQFFYFSVLVFIFQAGWAATQVSHVSLITDLTADTNERIALNSYRQAATIASNICLYTVTYFVIESLDSKNGGSGDGTIKKEDLVVFTYVAYIVCVIGLFFSLLFHLFVHEPETAARPRKVKPSVYASETKRYLQRSRGSQAIITLLANSKDEVSASRRNSTVSTISTSYAADPEEFERRLKALQTNSKRWYHWFKSLSFWKITILYTFARMFFNVTQVYTPLYLQYYLRMPKKTIAINPFATYFAGLVFSFAAKPLSARFGARVTLVVGAAFGLGTSVWIWFGHDESFRLWQVYIVAAFMGLAGTGLLISSLAMTSDLIGGNTATGAFVFAAMSFFDKSVNGIVIAVLEQCKPAEVESGSTEHIEFYRLVMVFLTGVPSICIVLVMLTIIRTNYGRRSRSNSVVSMAH